MDQEAQTFPNYGKVVPDAFHGTNANRGQLIEKNGFQLGGDDENSFCGRGVYFWEGSHEEARTWARKGNAGRQITIFQCTIQLNECMDLTVPENSVILGKFKNDLEKKTSTKIEIPVAISALARLSGAHTVRLHQKHPRNRVFDGTRFGVDTRTIICVRELSCIQTTKTVYTGL